MPRGNPQNLIHPKDRTPEERRRNAIIAGKASGKARREKKLISEIAREFLAKSHTIKNKGKIAEITTADLLAESWIKTLQRAGAPSVALTKVLFDTTEGKALIENMAEEAKKDQDLLSQLLDQKDE